MKSVVTRHELNPSFQPLPNSYSAFLPVLSGLYVNVNNNSLNLDDLLSPRQIDGNYKTAWFYSDANSIDDFYQRMKTNTQIYTENSINLYSFGIRILDKSYITVGLNTKVNAGVFIPKDLARLLLYGTSEPEKVNSFNLDRFGIRANAYTELALGYSQEIDSKLTVGGKLKLLAGHGNVTTKIDRFRLNASRERWNFDINGDVNISAPGIEYTLDERDRVDEFGLYKSKNFSAGDLSGGTGVAFDLGANYKLLDDRLMVSAAVLDLGFIKWKGKNAVRVPINGSFEFEGMDITFEDGAASWDEGYFDNVQDSIYYSAEYKPYMSKLAAKIILGAEYGILDNKMSFGALSKSTIVNKCLFQEITASFNYIQFDFFNASLSYSLLNGRFGTIGLGLGGRLGPFNLFFAGDYMPVKFAKGHIPYKNQAVNVQMGFLLNFGKRKARTEAIQPVPETVQPELETIQSDLEVEQTESEVEQTESEGEQTASEGEQTESEGEQTESETTEEQNVDVE
jgi:hypothetical protein